MWRIGIRRLACGLAALTTVSLSAAGSALAYDPPYNWLGAPVITKVTSACTGKWAVGTRLYSVYRPKLQSGEANSVITFDSNNGAAGLFQTTSTTSQLRGSGHYNSTTWGFSRFVPFTNSSTYSLTLSPTTVTNTTQFVEITGAIADFFNVLGCTVSFRGGYTLRPQ